MAAQSGVAHYQSWASDRGSSSGSLSGTQVIHSGHFMVSSPHSDTPPDSRSSEGLHRYDFDTVNRTWCQTYRFGPRSSGSLSIDPTINRLFECMSLAYSGNIVSPKWKSFKGLRLLWRDKIRLNNAIWRAWFIQYVEKRKGPVCGFVTPLEGLDAEAHRKPEAIVLEGSYWKRRIEVVIKEYHKWRIYHKKRLQKKKEDILLMLQEGPICQAKLEKWSNQMHQEPQAAPTEAHMFDLDCFLSDISDTLFTMTQKQCPWTSNRHNTYTSNADIIQPGLTPLQPNMDDFMDIPDIFMNYRGQPTETSGFADCDYFGSSSSVEFAPVGITPQLIIDDQLTQPRLSSDSLPRPPSASTEPDQTRIGPDCHEYRSSDVIPGNLLFGHQSFADTPVSTAFTAGIQQSSSSSTSLMYPPPCSKLDYHAATHATSTVITYTASSTGAAEPTHSYPHTDDTFSQTLCHPLTYSQDHTNLPSDPEATHCFSVPEQVITRGKHKQKRDGGSAIANPLAPSGHSTFTSSSTSCLAKLLSANSRGRNLSLGFKSRRSSSPSSLSSGSIYMRGASPRVQHGSNWHKGMESPFSTMCDQSGTRAPTHTLHASTSRGSAVPTLFNQGSNQTNTTLLIPKTEKLSPVPLYSSEKSSFTVHFPAHQDQVSPPHLLDRTSNPDSPHSGYTGLGKLDSSKQVESRRITHISAEQKRRFNIKLGFDTLHNLVTTLSSQPSIKISKATTLQKTAEYISKMQRERAQLHEETQKLKEEIQLLNSAINTCQLQLPATGVPITRQRFDHMRQKFREYVQAQTLQNWKFWMFSIIIEPLFESYNGMVSTASVEDLCQSTLSWLEQHCSLPAVRPMALSSLRLLSTTTAILTDPGVLPEQATLAVTQGDTPFNLDHSLQPSTQDNIHTM